MGLELITNLIRSLKVSGLASGSPISNQLLNVLRCEAYAGQPLLFHPLQKIFRRLLQEPHDISNRRQALPDFLQRVELSSIKSPVGLTDCLKHNTKSPRGITVVIHGFPKTRQDWRVCRFRPNLIGLILGCLRGSTVWQPSVNPGQSLIHTPQTFLSLVELLGREVERHPVLG